MSARYLFALPGHPAGVPALCPDGVTRTARPSGNGHPDTYFSIPAYVQVRGLHVSGYISSADDGAGYVFRPYTYARHGGIFGGAR